MTNTTKPLHLNRDPIATVFLFHILSTQLSSRTSLDPETFTSFQLDYTHRRSPCHLYAVTVSPLTMFASTLALDPHVVNAGYNPRCLPGIHIIRGVSDRVAQEDLKPRVRHTDTPTTSDSAPPDRRSS